MRRRVGAILAMGCLGLTGPAFAYCREAEFANADALIKKAECDIKPDTDVRITVMLAEATGALEAAQISHRQTTEKPTGATGKYLLAMQSEKGDGRDLWRPR